MQTLKDAFDVENFILWVDRAKTLRDDVTHFN